jgi:hypothetical protein
MAIEAIYWERQRQNNALLREALALLRLIAARLEPAGTTPTPTSPPSSSIPTATPSTSRPSVLRQALTKIAERFGREAIVSILMWAAGKLIPGIVAWLTLGRPALRWLESLAKWATG